MRHRIFADIDAERGRQEATFGSQRHDWAVWSAILTEEFGEVAEACLRARWGVERDLGHLRAELIQVAAVAVQMVEKIDSGDYQEPVSRNADAIP